KKAVIEMLDADTLYHVPIALQQQNFDDLVCEHLELGEGEADMTEWIQLVNKVRNLSKTIHIGLVGKYVELPDAYISAVEALKHAGFTYGTDIEVHWIDSENTTKEAMKEQLSKVDGIVVPGGFGTRGIDGKIDAIQYAREQDVPFLGICLGLQLAAVEYARNVLGLKDAHTAEVEEDATHPIVKLIDGQDLSEGIGNT